MAGEILTGVSSSVDLDLPIQVTIPAPGESRNRLDSIKNPFLRVMNYVAALVARVNAVQTTMKDRFPLSGSKTQTGLTMPSGSVNVLAELQVTVPIGKKLVLKRVRTGGNIGASGGVPTPSLQVFTNAGLQYSLDLTTAIGDQIADFVMHDNTAGSAITNPTVHVYLKHNGGTGTIASIDSVTWWLDLSIE
jgi:hypothetical protein